MSKSRPSQAERVQQSIESRTALIRALQATLSQADKHGVSDEEREKLRRRIADLKQRNRNPIDSLGRGSSLYSQWRYGSADCDLHRGYGW